MHRFLINAPKGKSVDHINGDTLDNRKENIRLCSHKENIRNRKINKNNKSGYKGVHIENLGKKWISQIVVDGLKIRARGFETAKEAAIHYNNMAIKYFGEFARLNQI